MRESSFVLSVRILCILYFFMIHDGMHTFDSSYLIVSIEVLLLLLFLQCLCDNDFNFVDYSTENCSPAIA